MKFKYLSSAKSNHQVSDEGVFSLSGAMANHHTPATALSQLTSDRQIHLINFQQKMIMWTKTTPIGVLRLDGLSDRANLVDFKQQTVAGLLVHCLLDPLWVGDSQVVTYDLIRAEKPMCYFSNTIFPLLKVFLAGSSWKNALVYLRFQKANKHLVMPIIVAKRKKEKRNRMTVKLCHMSACLSVHLTWMSTEEVNLAHCSQSSWSNGSSMDWTGERETLRRKFPQ